MARVVVVKTGGVWAGLATYLVFMGLVLLGLYPLFRGVAGVGGVVVAFVIFTIVSFFLVRRLLLYVVINRMVDRLRGLIEVRRGRIVFRRPVEAERGVLKYIGVWLGYYRHYHTVYEFSEESGRAVLREIDIYREPIDYTLLITHDRAGYLEAPSYFIVEPGLEGCVLAVLRPPRRGELSFSPEKTRLRASSGRDYSEATVEAGGASIRGSLILYSRSPRVKASIHLTNIIKLEKGDFYMSLRLAEVSGGRSGRADYSVSIYPSEPIILVGHVKTLSPYNIARVLGDKPLVYGIRRGDYRVRLELEAGGPEPVRDYTRVSVVRGSQASAEG